MAKKILFAVIGVIVLVVVVLAGLAIFLDANQFRPRLEATLSDATGRKVTVGNLRISWLSGGIAADDIAIADDPAFSRNPFITAKSVAIGVDLMPLIFSRSLRVESFTLADPHVALIRSASGVWNFSSLGVASSSSSSSSSASMNAIGVLVRKIGISGGQLSITGAAGRSGTRTYDGVDVSVSNVSLTSRSPFTISVNAPKGGSIKVNGEVGPPNLKNMAETPFHGEVTVKRLDMASTGFIDPASGIAGVLDFNGFWISDGVIIETKGRAKAETVQLLPGGAASRVPIAIDYESAYNSRSESGTIKKSDIRVGKAVAHLTGAYRAGGNTSNVQMTFVGKDLPVTELEAALPAIGVTLPSGATLKQGTLDLDLSISGPTDALTITGPVGLKNGTIAGFDLGEKLGAVAALAGLPKMGDTVIETLAAALRMTPSGLQIQNLDMVVPSIGSLAGEGTVAPNGALNFAMLAKLREQARASGTVGRIVSFAQTSGVPFKIQGSTSSPSFMPDVGRAAKDAVGGLKDAAQNPDNLKKAADALSDLFGRKK
jgi:AsmA protein